MKTLRWSILLSFVVGCALIISMWMESDFYHPRGICAYDPAPGRYDVFGNENTRCYLNPGPLLFYILYFSFFAFPVVIVIMLITRIAFEDIRERFFNDN